MIAEAEPPARMSDLDDTVVRKLDEVISAVTKKQPVLPPWLIPLCMYLLGHLVGSIWWAATMQSSLTYLQQDNMKAWQKIETHDLQMARQPETIRAAVREAMADAGYSTKKGEQ